MEWELKPRTNKEFNILIVDDEPKNVKLLGVICKSLGYSFITANNGLEGIEKTRAYLPDLVLMDVLMPQMNGFTATEKIKTHISTAHIPVIIITSLDSRDDLIKGISSGADDFLTKPIDAEELSLRVKNNLKIKEYNDFLLNINRILDVKVKEKTSELRDALTRLDKVHQKIKNSYIKTIHHLTLAAEYKDEDTGLHIQRASHYTSIIAEELGMDKTYTETIYYASPMHDIGKVGIPDGILLNNGPLTLEEWKIMKTHTNIGNKILNGSDSDFLKMASEIAISHHERWDGSGYPFNLKKDEIPLCGRIMNIADQYDALRSKRPYKPEYGHKKTLDIITKGCERTKPEHFDPDVLDAFCKVHKRFEEVYESLNDDK